MYRTYEHFLVLRKTELESFEEISSYSHVFNTRAKKKVEVRMLV